MSAPQFFQSEKEQNDAYNLYFNKNWTYEQIGAKYGTSKVTVKNLFKKKSWSARDRRACQITDDRFSSENLANYCNLYIQGISINAISKEFHIAPKKLSKILKERGIFVERTSRIYSYLPKILETKANKRAIKAAASPYSQIVTYKIFQEVAHYVTKQTKILIKKPHKIDIELDHKLSIHDAYYKTWKRPPTIFEIAHPANLEYLNSERNRIKNRHSSISLSELRRDIKIYNKNHGNPYLTMKFRNFKHKEIYK